LIKLYNEDQYWDDYIRECGVGQVVAWREDMKMHPNVCVRKTERKMSLRRQDVDRKHNIKMDLKLGGRALIGLLWSRSGYGVGGHVNMAVNRPIRKRNVDFLYALAGVGVSRCLRPP
jgi:hypothetical protein